MIHLRTVVRSILGPILGPISGLTLAPTALLGLVLAASGCEKANDMPRLQDEARATAQGYQERFDELSHRAEAISQRGNTLRADAPYSADAQRVYGEAMSTLEASRRLLQDLPAQIQAGGAPGAKDPDALPKLIDSVRERFEHAVIRINANLDAVESWITVAERQGSRSASDPVGPGGGEPAADPQPGVPGASIR